MMIARSLWGTAPEAIPLWRSGLRTRMVPTAEEWRVPDEETTTTRRRLWRAMSAAPLPLLAVIYGLWTDLLVLDVSGFHIAWSPGDFLAWLTLSAGTALLVAALWMPLRPVRMLAMAIHSLALSFGCGAAGVVAIVHTFGGPEGELTAPVWVLVALGLTSTLCALAVLALGALLVDDIRGADSEEVRAAERP